MAITISRRGARPPAIASRLAPSGRRHVHSELAFVHMLGTYFLADDAIKRPDERITNAANGAPAPDADMAHASART